MNPLKDIAYGALMFSLGFFAVGPLMQHATQGWTIDWKLIKRLITWLVWLRVLWMLGNFFNRAGRVTPAAPSDTQFKGQTPPAQ